MTRHSILVAGLALAGCTPAPVPPPPLPVSVLAAVTTHCSVWVVWNDPADDGTQLRRCVEYTLSATPHEEIEPAPLPVWFRFVPIPAGASAGQL